MYIILVLAAITAVIQRLAKQRFSEISRSGAFFFSAMIAFVSAMFFAIVNTEWTYSLKLLLPSCAFAVFYAMATVFSVLAVVYGPLAQSSLIISCSMLIPTFYGLFVQKVPMKPLFIPGLSVLIVTLFLVNYEKGNQEKKVTFKGLLFAFLGFLGNGMCSVVQLVKQERYGHGENNMFMISALLIVTLMLALCALFFKNERTEIKQTVQKGWWLALICGISNGLTNFFVLILNSNKFPASITFPVISGGTLVMIFLWSVLVKKEKFNVFQYTGYALGVISLALLNI